MEGVFIRYQEFFSSLRSYSDTFPFYETISITVCCSVSTVKRTLADLESLVLLEKIIRPGYPSMYTLNDYHEVVQNELGGRSKRAAKINELKKNDIKSNNIKTTSRSLDDISEGFIDKELKSKFATLPFDEIKFEILSDSTIVIKTEKQYRSILEYRLENWSPKKQKKTNGKTEIIPDWFEKNKEKNEADPVPNLNIDAERQKLLEELGVIDVQD